MKKVGLQNQFFIASGRLDFLEKKFEIYLVTGNSIRSTGNSIWSTGNSIRSQEIVFGRVPNLLLTPCLNFFPYGGKNYL